LSLSPFALRPLAHSWHSAKAAHDFLHFGLLRFDGFGLRVPNGDQDQILEGFDIAGIDDDFIELNALDRAGPVRGGFDHAAPGGSFDHEGLEFFLHFALRRLGFLHLLHQLLHVHSWIIPRKLWLARAMIKVCGVVRLLPRDAVHPACFNAFMTYSEALEWLYARTRSGLARGSERSRDLLEQFNNPQRAFRGVHVLGTNGKGSVCAMLEAGLRAAGDRVGRFTSPHLLDFRERITVDGLEIPESEVVRFVQWAQRDRTEAAFFDLSVVMAFTHFARTGVEIAVVEAGVGGARDATMNLENVLLTVITNVDFDHVETIGPNLRQIAFEKAGAIRSGVPVVTAARGEALEVIRAVALERGAELYVLEPEGLESGNELFALPHKPALRGVFQLENAALAVAGLRLLGLEDQEIEAALEASWPGRMEKLELQNRALILDGAHNPAAARALAASLKPGFALIFGAMARKDVRGVLEPLRELASEVRFVSPGALGADPHPLALEFDGQAFDDLEQALQSSLESVPERGRVLVTGSLYLVAEARKLLIGLGASLRQD
jgi:dihydrofolate synthase / folylpolyglutamate synthase